MDIDREKLLLVIEIVQALATTGGLVALVAIRRALPAIVVGLREFTTAIATAQTPESAGGTTVTNDERAAAVLRALGKALERAANDATNSGGKS